MVVEVSPGYMTAMDGISMHEKEIMWDVEYWTIPFSNIYESQYALSCKEFSRWSAI